MPRRHINLGGLAPSFSAAAEDAQCVVEHPPIYNIWQTIQKDFQTIDDEGLYDEPYVHAVVEIARAPCPITFQYRMDIRLIEF